MTKTLEEKVEQWFIDRNIHEANPVKQFEKLMEETGELFEGIAKDKPALIKDALGDMQVVLIGLEQQIKNGAEIEASPQEMELLLLVSSLFDVKSLDVYKMGDTERMTEMNVNQDEVTLMQSTGLFDKNGKEIFEGDIIDTTDYEGGLSSVGNPLVKVERDKYGFVVIGDFPASPITLKEFEAGRKFAGVEIIIAGNIYENPELVEVIDD